MDAGTDPDYLETEHPYKKLTDMGIDPGLPENMGLEPIPFIHLKPSQKEEVTEFYSYWWMRVLEAEHEAGLLDIPSVPGLPKNERILIGVWNQLKSSGRNFPEGQMVLVDRITDRPVVLTRSQLWHVMDFQDHDAYFRAYPSTWYMVSGYGNGYPWIPTMSGGRFGKFRDYEEVLERENPMLNLDEDLILSNYALTGNPRAGLRGASRAAVAERARYAAMKGIKHCDTCSPLNNYSRWSEERRKENPDYDCSPHRFVDENVVIPLNENRKPEYFTAIGMHKKFGASSMKIMPNAREYDRDSGGHCGFCRYF